MDDDRDDDDRHDDDRDDDDDRHDDDDDDDDDDYSTAETSDADQCHGDCWFRPPSVSVTIAELMQCPKCLFSMTSLNLRATGLREAPAYLGELENLTELNLASNGLSELSCMFAELHRLKRLDLSDNRFRRVPRCLVNGLDTLTALDLSRNRLTDLRGTRLLCVPALVTLDLSHNPELRSLPCWLWSIECVALQSLDISYTDCLHHVEPDPYLNMHGIADCLTSLKMSNASADVRKLDFVRHLKNISTIVLDNAPVIKYKHRNFFGKVPRVFNCRFKTLTSLSMVDVDLSNFGKRVYFSLLNVRTLNLSNNAISLIPDSFSQMINLETCNLSKNQILTVPESFRNLNNLKSLSLNNNWLASFPDILNDLTNLEYLDLYDNRIVDCPSWSLESSIKSVDLELNYFSSEDSGIINYSKWLKNLRSSINEYRDVGPLPVADPYDLDSFSESMGSSSHFSTHSSRENSIHGEIQPDNNYQAEELWECNSYENTTALFDPREFEAELFNELLKINPLTLEQEAKANRLFRNVPRLTNEHYFCPNDELPSSLSITK